MAMAWRVRVRWGLSLPARRVVARGMGRVEGEAARERRTRMEDRGWRIEEARVENPCHGRREVEGVGWGIRVRRIRGRVLGSGQRGW
jgi:hypothetical protein